ncbi:MAG: 50S ribosomal protein L21 [Candidatus Latescibacterota bacterium]|nr:MAG: 50S ribosomal protein L21 [Candidatus Latescibacterota bacterium]
MESYAIVDLDGCQCKVTADSTIRVPRMAAEVGAEVSFDKVMLWSDGKAVHVGTPYVEGKAVQAEVVRHGKTSKIIVFKKKRRKDYRRTKGHRQDFTEIRIKALPK